MLVNVPQRRKISPDECPSAALCYYWNNFTKNEGYLNGSCEKQRLRCRDIKKTNLAASLPEPLPPLLTAAVVTTFFTVGTLTCHPVISD